MDTSQRGKINIDELKVGLQKLGHTVPQEDLQILMEAVSFLFIIYLQTALLLELLHTQCTELTRAFLLFFAGRYR